MAGNKETAKHIHTHIQVKLIQANILKYLVVVIVWWNGKGFVMKIEE